MSIISMNTCQNATDFSSKKKKKKKKFSVFFCFFSRVFLAYLNICIEDKRIFSVSFVFFSRKKEEEEEDEDTR